MGRNSTIDWLPHYREVLVATAVRTVRDSMPVVRAFATGRRAWLNESAEGWRAVAIAAGAVSDQAVTR